MARIDLEMMSQFSPINNNPPELGPSNSSTSRSPGSPKSTSASQNVRTGSVCEEKVPSQTTTPALHSTRDLEKQQRESETSAPVPQKFRRARASKACEICHTRKVRCDARDGKPCTNCIAFDLECVMPVRKAKKGSITKPLKTSDEEGELIKPDNDVTQLRENPQHNPLPNIAPAIHHAYTDCELPQNAVSSGDQNSTAPKARFSRAPITDAGRVAFLGESSNLNLIVTDKGQDANSVHYPLPGNVRERQRRANRVDKLEMEILTKRGAFLLPPKAICDELVNAYFQHVHPIVPLVNRSRFMKQYEDPENPPSILLCQAILLAGCRVSDSKRVKDNTGTTASASLTFYRRAKALYEADYEDDRITIVQSLILMGWYWEGPEDVTKNVYHWTNLAITVAQGSGMHRDVEKSQLSKVDKRLWKRVWWTLFTRDRSVAVALGRPVRINLDDSDIPMLTEDDFIEDEDDTPSKFPPDPTHVTFFLQYVKLVEIMGLVLSQQYTPRPSKLMDVTTSDMPIADWLHNCPLVYNKEKHSFWPAVLFLNYYTSLCLLHRAYIPPASATTPVNTYGYPSRNIAIQAAENITAIVEKLSQNGELQYVTGFVVYSMFSALLMHVYRSGTHDMNTHGEADELIKTTMRCLKELEGVWMTAKMLHKLFSGILGNKALEARLHYGGIKRQRDEISGGGDESMHAGQSKRQYHEAIKNQQMGEALMGVQSLQIQSLQRQQQVQTSQNNPLRMSTTGQSSHQQARHSLSQSQGVHQKPQLQLFPTPNVSLASALMMTPINPMGNSPGTTGFGPNQTSTANGLASDAIAGLGAYTFPQSVSPTNTSPQNLGLGGHATVSPTDTTPSSFIPENVLIQQGQIGGDTRAVNRSRHSSNTSIGSNVSSHDRASVNPRPPNVPMPQEYIESQSNDGPFSATTSGADLYLFTRKTPNLSQSLLQNFQPNQLFPHGSNLPSYTAPATTIDPRASVTGFTQPGMDSRASLTPCPPAHSTNGLNGVNLDANEADKPMANFLSGGIETGFGLAQNTFGNQNSGPAGLNVEEWFEFFGLGNDLTVLNNTLNTS